LFVPSLKEIAVSKIDGVPDSIKDSNISSIYFKSCSVNGIFSKLPVTLKTFDCNLCKLQVMDGIERLTNLSSLNLPGNNIKTIPNLKDLASLSVLKLERNAITVIPDETAALKSLTVLDLSENPIIAIPDSLGTSTSIKELKLESTNINTIPASLSRLATLESLSIRDAPLNEAIFATTPGGYPKLSRCSLDRDIFCSSESTPAPKACSLKPCPSQNIQQECQLARDAFLKISRSEVFLPSKIFCCSNYLITCADDHITEIKWTDTYSDPNVLFPSELTKLPYLSVLNLENHQLTGPLPADLSNWKNMTYLNLRARPCSFCDSEGNRVRKLNGTLPASLFTEKLKYLSLEENNFEGTFPNTLSSSTTSLTDLNMKANYRLKGPVLKTLVEFPNLTTLELSKVVLNETIPDIDSKWTKLKTLDLSETKLYGTVPESLGNLPNLTLVYLGRNALQGGFTNKQNQWSKLQVCSLYNSGLCIAPSGLPEACDGSLDSNYCSNPAIDAQCATVSSWYEASEQVSPIPKSDCCSSYEVTCSATGIIKLYFCLT
jgi:Leucine-rich repeat (LRR) protein